MTERAARRDSIGMSTTVQRGKHPRQRLGTQFTVRHLDIGRRLRMRDAMPDDRGSLEGLPTRASVVGGHCGDMGPSEGRKGEPQARELCGPPPRASGLGLHSRR